MVLSKKRLVLITVFLSFLYFLLFMLLPESVIGERGDNLMFFAPKVMFLALTAAIVSAIILILIFKRSFILWQFASFNRFKHYLKLLVKRDFISRYRKSVLGVLWSLLNPLLIMLVMTLVFSTLFGQSIRNFPVYMLSGQIIFGFFSESTTLAMGSVIASEGVIKKVYIPKYIFPLSRVMSSLVNLLFSFLAFMLVFIFTREPFKLSMLLMPVPIIYTFVFSLGVSMILSSLAVFFRDLTYLYGVFLTLLMYMTPLFYPVTIIPDWLMPFYGFNPLYHFVDYFRALTYLGIVPDLWSNMVCAGFSLAALCGGVYVFMSQQEKHILYL